MCECRFMEGIGGVDEISVISKAVRTVCDSRHTGVVMYEVRTFSDFYAGFEI